MIEIQQSRKTVAVVGSGMAGLVTAYLLQQDRLARYSVKIFETVMIENCYPSITSIYLFPGV